MKILMLLYNPFTNDARVYNEARSLVQAGHEVTVIAFDREKQNLQRETWDGIRVVRLRTKLAPTQGFGWPLWNGLILLLWQRQAYRQAIVLHKERHFSVIHCHDFDTLLAGTWLKRKLGLPLIYDAHEIFGYALSPNFPSWIANMFLSFERKLITKVDTIITDGEGQKGYFDNITNKPVSVVMNCKPLQSLEYEPTDSQGKYSLVYIGLLDEVRSISRLIRVAGELPDVHLIIGGLGWPLYIQTIIDKCSKYPNIDFIGKVPLDQVIPLTKKADVVLLIIDPQNINNRLGLANKQFEAMVCGRPIICTKGTYSGDFTEKENVGLTVEHTDEALKRAIIELRDNTALREKLGRNALKAAIAKYNWENQEKILLSIYKNIKLCKS